MLDLKLTNDRYICFLLFVMSTLFYVLLMRGFDPGEGIENYKLALEFLRFQRVGFLDGISGLNRSLGIDGRWYNIHDFGNGVAMLPFAAAQLILGTIVPKVATLNYFFLNVYSSFMAGAAVAAEYYILRKLEIPVKRSVIVAILLGLTTQIFPYSRDAYDGVFIMACLAWTFVAIVDFYKTEKTSSLFLAGAGLGWMIIARPTSILWLPVLIIVGVLKKDRIKKNILYLFFSLLPFALWQFYYDYLRTGNPLLPANIVQGVGVHWKIELWKSLPALLFSPDCGVFYYNPILFLAPWGISSLYTKWKKPVIAGAFIIVINVLVHASIKDWGTYWSWGPRFMVMILPLLFVPIAFIPDISKPTFKVIVGTLASISFIIQLLAVSVDHSNLIHFHPNRSQFGSPWELKGSKLELVIQEFPHVIARITKYEPQKTWPVISPARQFAANYGSFWFNIAPAVGVSYKICFLLLFIGFTILFIFSKLLMSSIQSDGANSE